LLVPAEVRSVRVSGSRAVAHSGRLEVLPDGAGAEFVPRRPFAAGERVSVSAILASRAAGRAARDPSSTRLRFSFGVAVTRSAVPAPADGPPPQPAATQASVHSFHSAPGLHTSLTSIGGPSNGTVWDSVIQEVDIATGKLLISSRNTWSLYKVSIKTGHILWTLGGKYNQFKMGPGTQFEWQHDPHRVGNTLTLFDDASHPQEERQSSAKILHIDVPAKTVTLVKRFTHTPPVLSPAQGSLEILPNGKVFVGWGSVPYFSEYSRRGRQIFSGSFALGTTSYRAFRFPWNAQPDTRPAMAASRRGKGGTNVWASWNGATNVADWRALGGPSAARLHRLSTRPSTGFETHLTLSGQPGYVEVQALGVHGHVLGTSSLHALG
jgi:hypothetical protein